MVYHLLVRSMIYLCSVVDGVIVLEDKTKNGGHVCLVLLRVHLPHE